MTTSDTSVREWVDQKVRRLTGFEPRRFGAASEGEQARLVERFGARFSVSVDEETGSSTVELSESGEFARSADETTFSAPASALRNRAALLLPDAIERLTRLRPVVDPGDTKAIESATRVVETTLRQLQGAFRADEFFDEIELYFDQLLDEDEYGDAGHLGRLGAALGLLDRAAVTSLDDDRSLAQYLTIRGHLECLRAGWRALDNGGESFGAIAVRVAERAECIERRSDELSVALGDDACVDIVVEHEGRAVELGAIVDGVRQQAAVWRYAALASRADLLAQRAYVDLYVTKLHAVLESGVLGDRLDGDERDRAVGLVREIADLANRISLDIERLQDRTGPEHAAEES